MLLFNGDVFKVFQCLQEKQDLSTCANWEIMQHINESVQYPNFTKAGSTNFKQLTFISRLLNFRPVSQQTQSVPKVPTTKEFGLPKGIPLQLLQVCSTNPHLFNTGVFTDSTLLLCGHLLT